MISCSECGGQLVLVKSARFGFCWTCSRSHGRVAYVAIGHSEPHPYGLTLGQAARDDGTARVLENAGDEWRDRCAAMIDELARRLQELTADDVRAEAAAIGLEDPHHYNAWGAALLAAGRRGVIRRTMRLKASTRPEANAHSNPIWISQIHVPIHDPQIIQFPVPTEVW